MYHIFLIHSFVDGHLGCFNVLAIVNNAVKHGVCQSRFLYKKKKSVIKHIWKIPQIVASLRSTSCTLTY